MRFKEFLIERSTDSLQDVIHQIRSNCKPFLKHGRMLYRGFSPFMMKDGGAVAFDENKAFYSPHPVGRKPRDSANAKHFNFMFNGGIEAAFGIEQIREKTIFATNSPILAQIFGHATFFFPVGDFKFITSKKLSDSFEDSSKVRTVLGKLTGFNPLQIREGFNVLGDKMKPHDWLTSPEKAIKLTMEAFASDDDQLYFTMRDALKTVYSELYMNTPNFSHFKFPSEGGELMFYETHGYYSIPAKMLMNEMSKNGIEHAGVPEDENVRSYLRQLIAGESDEV